MIVGRPYESKPVLLDRVVHLLRLFNACDILNRVQHCFIVLISLPVFERRSSKPVLLDRVVDRLQLSYYESHVYVYIYIYIHNYKYTLINNK